jgi:hypothetical protein
MTVHEQIIAALAPLGIPVTAHVGDASQPVYAVIHDLVESAAQSADDQETVTAYHIQINIVSRTNPEALAGQATALLNAAGFRRRDKRTEYEPESNVFCAMLRIAIVKDYMEE